MTTRFFRISCALGFFLSVACAAAEDVAPGVDAGAAADASTPAVDAGPAAPFTLSSSAFVDGGTLPRDYTCDGAGTSPPLAWSGRPAGTVEYALMMTTLARDGLKWNWVLYGIPGGTAALAAGERAVGRFGLTSDGPNLVYYPPCSQGPGAKSYTFTLYALSSSPSLPADPRQVNGGTLTAALAAVTLATAEVTVSYTRP